MVDHTDTPIMIIMQVHRIETMPRIGVIRGRPEVVGQPDLTDIC